MASARIVVVGAGPAGIAAAVAARRSDPARDITVLAAEDADPYEKPPLSKAVLTEAADPSSKPIVPIESLAGIRLLRGVAVTAIDRERRLVQAAGMAPLPYDALVLATGARLRELPALPRGRPGVFYLRDAADALALRAALAAPGRPPSVAVVGAGLIGLEVAAAAVARGASVTVIEAAPSAMARLCSPGLAQRIIDRHARAGVLFRWGTSVSGVAAGLTLQLADGGTVTADAMVVGIGVQPEIALAEAAGLAVDGGILVDAQCRSSDPAIFAAGDVARFATPWCEGAVRLENWRHALEQGEVAGLNVAGGAQAYMAVPSFWSDQYELMLQGVGWPDGLAATALRRDLAGGGAVEFHLVDGRLRYAIGIGAAREIAVARRLIERKAVLDPAMLADPAVALPSLLRAAA